MTEAAQFTVDIVFDLPNQKGLLVSGKLTGHLRAGAILEHPETGTQTKVLAVEFETPTDRQTGRTTLQLQRTTPQITPGTTFISRRS